METEETRIAKLEFLLEHEQESLKELKEDFSVLREKNESQKEMIKEMMFKMDHSFLTLKKTGAWIVGSVGVLSAAQILIKWIAK